MVHVQSQMRVKERTSLREVEEHRNLQERMRKARNISAGERIRRA